MRTENTALHGHFLFIAMNDKNIKALSEQVVTENGFLYIDTIVRGHKSAVVIEIFMDSPGELTIDDCAKISRIIDEQLIASGDAGENFRLDVSSPGIDRPLKYLAQYQKNLNRKFEVVFKENDAEEKFLGILTRIDGNTLYFINKSKQEKIISYDSIVTAQMQVSFS